MSSVIEGMQVRLEQIRDQLGARIEVVHGASEEIQLQIKTPFRHAWTEASHDLAYKAAPQLTTLCKRKVAFTAAQAWGADQFSETYMRNSIELLDL